MSIAGLTYNKEGNMEFTPIRKGKHTGKYQGSDGKLYTKEQAGAYVPPVVERPKAAKRAARKKAPQQEVKKESKSRISER
jgi:hypothetical protein